MMMHVLNALVRSGECINDLLQNDDVFDAPDPRRFLTQSECTELAKRVMGFTNGKGRTTVFIQSRWTGEMRWARNRVSVAGDRRNNTVLVCRSFRGGAEARATTNQIDDTSLQAAVQATERIMRHYSMGSLRYLDMDAATKHDYPKPYVWDDATYNQEPPTRGVIASALIDPAEQAGMLAAGYINVAALGTAYIDSVGRSLYQPQTFAQASMTVRNPKGTGSGWGGCSSYNWTRFDAKQLAATALEKCLRSQNPSQVEPGRYTLIMEPQAVYDFVKEIVTHLERIPAEGGVGPFAVSGGLREKKIVFQGRQNQLDISKVGSQVLDERITIEQDPTDQDLGVRPFHIDRVRVGRDVEPYRPIKWIDHGVLHQLGYERHEALYEHVENEGFPNSRAFRMSGGTTSVEEMIATTQRGLMVTRFSGVTLLEERSLLSTGLTRDGLWLIEKGKISRPVTNFRFTESPLFAFNNVEQLGEPVPVFSPELPAVVPPVKVRDFSFTSLIDAI